MYRQRPKIKILSMALVALAVGAGAIAVAATGTFDTRNFAASSDRVPIGYLDVAATNCQTITGWAWDPDSLNISIKVHLYVDGKFVSEHTADIYRSDLVSGGFTPDNGKHGYQISFPVAYRNNVEHKVEVYGINTKSGGANKKLEYSPMFYACNATTLLSRTESVLKTDLSDLGVGNLSISIKYINKSSIGYAFPNYEYTSHFMKLTANSYVNIFGGRCFYDTNKKCQIPVNSSYPITSGVVGDGDHPRLATSTNAINWTIKQEPLVIKGQYETPAVPATNLDWGNHMDPTVISKNGKYYMYVAAQSGGDRVSATSPVSPLCPGSYGPSAGNQTAWNCSGIIYSTSTDLNSWTKGQPLGSNVLKNYPINKGTTNGVTTINELNWPKTIVVGNEVWLYFGLITHHYAADREVTQEIQTYLVKSTDPTSFDFTKAVKVNPNFGGIGQFAILWPEDSTKRLFVEMSTDWDYKNESGFWVPVIYFSKDGINFTRGKSITGGFPAIMKSQFSSFCGIGSEVNGAITPTVATPNSLSTYFFCSTSNGQNCLTGGAESNSICQTNIGKENDIWHSDLMEGSFKFDLTPLTCTPVCTGKSCGDSDGCSGKCIVQSCGTGKTCNASATCVSTCVPSCSGKSCGDDGCGGSCGTCTGGKTCNASFQCVTPTCTPVCTGKSCGDSDGCGGKCVVQTCGTGKTCNASGTCAAVTFNVADINQDGAVNGSDYNLFVIDYLKFRNSGTNTPRSDLNSDGKVNGTDYSAFVVEYLKARQ